MDKSQWVWMPHPGHFIGSRNCQFHLATYLPSGFLVSTVGEYLPDYRVREIMAQSRGIAIQGKGDTWDADYMKKIGFEDIGWDRKYETMVFKAVKTTDGLCCPYRMENGSELDMDGYNDPELAYQGHLSMCEKWSAMTVEAYEATREDV